MTSLDVGCGKHKLGNIGVDIKKSSDADVIADVHFLPFRNEVFDKVIAFAVLEHVDNPVRSTEELFRVCRVNGRVKVLFPNRSLLYGDIIGHAMNFNIGEVIKQRLAFKKGDHKWQLDIVPMLRLFSRFGVVLECFRPSYRFLQGRKGKVLRRFVRFPCWFVVTEKVVK